LARGRPVLGICLGSQIMARALGSRVYATGRKEIGWSPLVLAPEPGCLAPLTPDVAVLHWHGDTFDLPAGAQHLASTAQTPNQAFAWARHGLALQFHLEATVRGLERWYVGHACEIASTAGLSVDLLRRQAADGSPRLVAPAQAVVERWLAGLAA
jgi:GMP synthase (glutamine-hydrolysing)